MDRDELALDAARQIEDLFTQHHAGGRTQRLAEIQRVVRWAIYEAVVGDRPTDRPGNPHATSAPQADVRGKDGKLDKPFSDYLKADPDKGTD